MKTKITIVAALAMGVMSFVTSCSNEMVEPAADAVMLEAEVSAIANTRAVVEGTSLPAGSEYGLYVFQGFGAVSGNIKMSVNSTSTGYLLTNNSEVKVCAYYPYSEYGVDGEDVISIYPGTTDYLHTVSSEIYTQSNPKASVTLHHALARVKFNVTVAADAKGSYEVYFNELGNVYTKGFMRLGIDGDGVYGHYKSNGIVSVEPIKEYLKAGSVVTTEVFLVPQNLKDETPNISFNIDGEIKNISADIVNATFDSKWESGKVYTYNITIKDGVKLSVAPATIEEWGEAEVLEGVTAKEEQEKHEYVDLGLSVKWATCNVGANAPEEYGLYFAWGETTGYTQNTSDGRSFDWANYKWCKGSSSTMTKYCTNSSYGTVDNKTVLEPEDDAAHVNWGGDWRIPTKEEQDELRNSCTWTWTTLNGVNGCKVVGKNGNFIFLPAAGCRNDSSSSNVGSYGYYWSSSLNSDYSNLAYYLYFYSGRVGWDYYYRYNGHSVRAVCP